MSADPSVDPESTEALVARADRARARFLHSVDALDRKRHQLARPARAVGKTLEIVAAPTFQPAVVVVGALASAAVLTAVVVQARRREQRRSIFTPQGRSFWGELAWHAGLALASITLTGAARLGLRSLLQGARSAHRASLDGARGGVSTKDLRP